MSFIGRPRTCSSLIDGPGRLSLYTVSTILRQTLTGCRLRTPREVEGYNRSSRRISLVLWGWTGTFEAALISLYKWYRSVMLGGLHSIRRMARQFTAQLQRSLFKDNKSRSLHESGTILCDGVFEQAPQTDAKHFRKCSGFLRVQCWGRKQDWHKTPHLKEFGAETKQISIET